MVYKKRHGWERQQFRKLAVSQAHWGTTLTTAPDEKCGYTHIQAGVTLSTGTPIQAGVLDGTAATVKVPEQFVHAVR